MLSIFNNDPLRSDVEVVLASGEVLNLHTVIIAASCRNLHHIQPGTHVELGKTSFSSVATPLLQLAYGATEFDVDPSDYGHGVFGARHLGLNSTNQTMIEDKLLATLRVCDQSVFLSNVCSLGSEFLAVDPTNNTPLVQKIVDITKSRTADINVTTCPSLFALTGSTDSAQSAIALIEALEQSSELTVLEQILSSVDEIPGNALWPLSFVAVGGDAKGIIARLQDEVASRFESIPETDLALLPSIITSPLLFSLLKKNTGDVKGESSQKVGLKVVADGSEGSADGAAVRVANGEIRASFDFNLLRGSTVSARGSYTGQFEEVKDAVLCFASVECSVSNEWSVAIATRALEQVEGAALAPINVTVTFGDSSWTTEIKLFTTPTPQSFSEAAKNASRVIRQTLAGEIKIPRTVWYATGPGQVLPLSVAIHK